MMVRNRLPTIFKTGSTFLPREASDCKQTYPVSHVCEGVIEFQH